MFLLTVSLLHQILMYLRTQKIKVHNKYLLNKYNDQSAYLGLLKVIFLLGNEIINFVQRYIIPESCLPFLSLAEEIQVHKAVFVSRKFLLSFQTYNFDNICFKGNVYPCLNDAMISRTC